MIPKHHNIKKNKATRKVNDQKIAYVNGSINNAFAKRTFKKDAL